MIIFLTSYLTSRLLFFLLVEGFIKKSMIKEGVPTDEELRSLSDALSREPFEKVCNFFSILLEQPKSKIINVMAGVPQ